ncbi:MAG: hypothetical protein U9Q69_00315 [Nanoarchaeota archaeon]|nr:hypothetical protein [Nanoarchaeota archaeon]
MADLILVVSSGKGTWAQASKLIKQEDWSHVFIICNEFGKEKFTCEKPCTYIIINSFGTVEEIKNKILEDLKGKLKMDIGVNFISGTGKEHMGLCSALFKLGVGIRLVVADEVNIKEI